MAVVEQVCVVVDHMLHHGVHLQSISAHSPSTIKADQHFFFDRHSPVHYQGQQLQTMSAQQPALLCQATSNEVACS